MHVGLNLIYLVPGETGGMEVVARELIPELLAAAGGQAVATITTRTSSGASLTKTYGITLRLTHTKHG